MLINIIERHEFLLCVCVLLLMDVISASVPIYDQTACDRIITIGGTTQAGRLMYRYSPSSTPRMCNITIYTTGGQMSSGGAAHQVAYAFLETDAVNNFKCSSVIYIDNGYNTVTYCGNNVYPKNAFVTRDRTLELDVVGDGRTEFTFDLLFLSFHNGSCLTYETRCNGLFGDTSTGIACVYYSLVCHEKYTFCETSGTQCGDIISETGSNGTVIAVIVVTLVLVLLVGVGCFLCYRNNFCGFLKRNSSEEDVRTRAMNVFSLQLASRGVDGNDNSAYTDDEGGPIDFSKFDPPPEYSSLENLENAGTTEPDGNTGAKEDLPSYGDVMKNFDEYSINTQI